MLPTTGTKMQIRTHRAEATSLSADLVLAPGRRCRSGRRRAARHPRAVQRNGSWSPESMDPPSAPHHALNGPSPRITILRLGTRSRVAAAGPARPSRACRRRGGDRAAYRLVTVRLEVAAWFGRSRSTCPTANHTCCRPRPVATYIGHSSLPVAVAAPLSPRTDTARRVPVRLPPGRRPRPRPPSVLRHRSTVPWKAWRTACRSRVCSSATTGAGGTPRRRRTTIAATTCTTVPARAAAMTTVVVTVTAGRTGPGHEREDDQRDRHGGRTDEHPHDGSRRTPTRRRIGRGEDDLCALVRQGPPMRGSGQFVRDHRPEPSPEPGPVTAQRPTRPCRR